MIKLIKTALTVDL